MQKGSRILADTPAADCDRVIDVARAMQVSTSRAADMDDVTRFAKDAHSNPDSLPPFDFLDPAEESGELGRIGLYSVRRVIGRGGMGVLFEAFDPRLKRTVALKVILDNRLVNDRYRARFETEALALARLQHPNIVQIYEVTHHHGRPFFVLEYLAGGNLAEYLAARPQPVLDCAVIVRTLAQAVQYAHGQAIVHRDLKPANILLSRKDVFAAAGDGIREDKTSHASAANLKIVDFGLARHLEQPGLTQTGELLGTPGYMAPELTRPVGEPTGPAVDIYALGAILYETMTGRPPFQGDSVLSTLDQVRTLDPVPPRRLRPSVPRDLETICLKCLHKEPSRRYQTAAALADDLTRYLEGRPIVARPIGPIERLKKGVRRRPLLASLLSLAALMVLGTIGGVSYHNVELREQVERADKEANRAVRAKELADQQYQQAWQSLNRIVESVNERGASAIPEVLELQRKQSELALKFFEGVVAAQTDPDPRRQRDLAFACSDAARLQIFLGRTADAEKNLARAIGLLEKLNASAETAGADNDDPDHLSTLAACYDYLGLIKGAQPNRGDEGVALGRKAVELLERLVEADPSNPRLKYNLAGACDNLGTSFRTNPGGSVLEFYERSLKLLREVHACQPEDRTFAVSLAQTCSNIGPVYAAAEQLEKASAVYEEAQTILEPLVAAEPQNNFLAFSLAALRINLGALQQIAGKEAQALEQYTRSLDALHAILQRESNYAQARENLLPAYGGRAQTFSRLARHAEAAKDWVHVIELAPSEARPGYRVQLAHALVAAGQLDKAAKEIDNVAEAETTNAAYWYEAGQVHAEIAAALIETPIKAGSHAKKAMTWLRRAAAAGFFKEPAHAAFLENSIFSSLKTRPDFQRLLRETPSSSAPAIDSPQN